MYEPHNSYQWSQVGGRSSPPPHDYLRIEDATRPSLGDLIQPGQLFETNYGTGPYRVEAVTRCELFGGAVVCWSITGRRVRDGIAQAGENGLGWINELVVEWDGDTPRFRAQFKNNDDEVLLIDGRAYTANRKGQLSLF